MLKMFKNKKAQNTAEYAILIALVVGGVVAMQTYSQRTLQGRLRDASAQFTAQTGELGNTAQYEPYYTQTSSDNDKIAQSTDTYESQVRNTVTGKKQATYSDNTTYWGNTSY